jgi:ribosome maturation factor RimP
MSVEQQRFYELLAPTIEAVGCELLGVQISRGRQHTVLRLYIDRLQGGALAEEEEQGITIEDCTRVSHQVSGVLDVEDPIAGEYSLEVSSPGDDRPLFRLQHYERFIGHRIRVRLAVPVDGRRSVTGPIVSVEDGKVVVEEDSVQWRLAMEQIALARLVPDL